MRGRIISAIFKCLFLGQDFVVEILRERSQLLIGQTDFGNREVMMAV